MYSSQEQKSKTEGHNSSQKLSQSIHCAPSARRAPSINHHVLVSICRVILVVEFSDE